MVLRVTHQRELDLAKKYHLSVGDLEDMLDEQNYKCAICDRDFDFSIRSRTPHVDHNHRTGKTRGLLCTSCNTGLGHFRDSTRILARAILYLDETR